MGLILLWKWTWYLSEEKWKFWINFLFHECLQKIMTSASRQQEWTSCIKKPHMWIRNLEMHFSLDKVRICSVSLELNMQLQTVLVCCAGCCWKVMNFLLDVPGQVIEVFHATFLMFGEARPKAKLWPFSVTDSILFLWKKIERGGSFPTMFSNRGLQPNRTIHFGGFNINRSCKKISLKTNK